MAQCRASNHRIFFGRHSLKWQSLALHQFAHAEDLKEFNTLWLVGGGTLFFPGRSLDFKRAVERNGGRHPPFLRKRPLWRKYRWEFEGGPPSNPGGFRGAQ